MAKPSTTPFASPACGRPPTETEGVQGGKYISKQLIRSAPPFRRSCPAFTKVIQVRYSPQVLVLQLVPFPVSLVELCTHGRRHGLRIRRDRSLQSGFLLRLVTFLLLFFVFL